MPVTISVTERGQGGGGSSYTVGIVRLTAPIRCRQCVGRQGVAGIKKRAKEIRQFRTPLRPGSLPDAFVGMPCFGGIAKVVDGNQPFLMV